MTDATTSDRTGLESEHVEIGDRPLLVRPLGPGDAALERDFIDNLSAESRHYRFLGGVKHLTPREIAELCDIDYESRMAYVAIDEGRDGETAVGVSRYAVDPDGQGSEFAVTVADAWQSRGLGTLLMRKLIDYARAHRVKRLYSIDAADNDRMRRLARDLGMRAQRDPDDAHQVIYSLAGC